MITTLKDWKLFKESNNHSRTEADIKAYIDVKVGDKAYENPDAGGQWDNELGEVLWVGDYSAFTISPYYHLCSAWEIDEDDTEAVLTDYDLIVIEDEDGPKLYNYYNDPSGCVVFKNANEALDKVGQEDDDINNDGQVDNQDDYLANKRKVISTNVKENNLIGQEGEVSQAEYPTLSVKFDINQKDEINSVIEELKNQGHIKEIEKFEDDKTSLYVSIKFDSVYAVYLFGYLQAQG